MNATERFLGEPAGWKNARLRLVSLQALWGGWVISLSGNGDCLVQQISPVRQERRYRLALTETEAHSILDAGVRSDVLSLPAPARAGVPDETLLQLSLVNPAGEACTVCKWAGDRSEAFEAASRPLFALTRRTESMQPEFTGLFEWPAAPPGGNA